MLQLNNSIYLKIKSLHSLGKVFRKLTLVTIFKIVLENVIFYDEISIHP